MNRRAIAVTVAVLLLATAVAPIALGATVSAQEGGETSSSENATQTPESSSDGAEGGETTVVRDVDDSIRVTAYRYDEANQTMLVTLQNRGDVRSTVTLTEAIEAGGDGGSSTFGIERVRVGGGERVQVAVDVRRNSNGEAGVMITTQQSIQQGQGTVLWDVDRSGVSLLDGEPAWGTVWFGIVAGLVLVGLIMILAAWQFVATKHDDVDDVDLLGDQA